MNLLPSITIVLLFACLVAYEYIKDLRRSLKDAKREADTYGRLYEQAANDLRVAQGKPPHTEHFFPEGRTPAAETDKPVDAGFSPKGIGPTVINDREQRRQYQDAQSREPRFANVGVLVNRQPTSEEIAAAAREVADGERPN